MIDVFLGNARRHRPGGGAPADVALEKAIYEIPNVEYVYSTTQPSGGMIIVRFTVGTDPDQAAVRVHTKLQEKSAELPAGALPPLRRLARDRRRPGPRLHALVRRRLPDAAQAGRRGAEGRADEAPPRRAGDGPRRRETGAEGHLRPRPPRGPQRLLLQAYMALSGANWRSRPGASPRPTPRPRSRSAPFSATPTR